jgi:coenzyme F420 hydrogenase subunit beta
MRRREDLARVTKQAKTIESVVKGGLCTGCGTCAGLCPKRAVEMMVDRSQGVYHPMIDQDRCDGCGLCFQICPGHTVQFKHLSYEIFGKELVDTPLGNHLNCYMGNATDSDIRHNAASGGVVTGLLISALKRGLIDGALVTRMREDRPLEAESFIARNKDDIISASKSKYCPVPANVSLREIIEKDGRYAVVGLPCHIQGVRKAMSVIPKLRNRVILCLSLLCGHCGTFFETELLLHMYCREIEIKNITRLDYRGGGWPGFMKIHFNDNKAISIPYKEYIVFYSMFFFAQKRCLLCCDAVSRLSDITVMDAWLPEIMERDKQGTSLLIVRTEAGERFCDCSRLMQVVELQAMPSIKLIQSQGTQHLLNKDLPVFLFLNRILGKHVPSYDLRLLRPGPVNWLRAVLMYWNSWVSSKPFFNRYVPLLARLESTAYRAVKRTVKMAR